MRFRNLSLYYLFFTISISSRMVAADGLKISIMSVTQHSIELLGRCSVIQSTKVLFSIIIICLGTALVRYQ